MRIQDIGPCIIAAYNAKLACMLNIAMQIFEGLKFQKDLYQKLVVVYSYSHTL